MICERCSSPVHQFELCNYCNKKICVSCTKAAKRVEKTDRFAICKSCWGNMKSRTRWKKE
ncbi:hypothetical protein FJZ26_01180 [Candidatus Parvarchaeota archaeon]|nr:hypothetical protein [Candidatus Parvarchaeota archaeon]